MFIALKLFNVSLYERNQLTKYEPNVNHANIGSGRKFLHHTKLSIEHITQTRVFVTLTLQIK